MRTVAARHRQFGIGNLPRHNRPRLGLTPALRRAFDCDAARAVRFTIAAVFADCQCRGYRRMMSDQLDWKLAVKRLRINSMLAAAIIRQKSKIRQSRTLRQSISTRVRLIPNSAYVRKLYVPFVFLTNLESEDDDHLSCLSLL